LAIRDPRSDVEKVNVRSGVSAVEAVFRIGAVGRTKRRCSGSSDLFGHRELHADVLRQERRGKVRRGEGLLTGVLRNKGTSVSQRRTDQDAILLDNDASRRCSETQHGNTGEN